MVGAAAAPTATGFGCVPQPYLLVQPRSSGPAGTEVEVRGTNFEVGPPEIRWNGLDGALLGKASSPEFTLTVTIPEAGEGLYSLVAVSRGPQGQVAGVTRSAFAVTGQGSTTTTTTPPQPPPTRRPETTQVPAMLVGAALTAAGGAAGAAMTRRRLKPSG